MTVSTRRRSGDIVKALAASMRRRELVRRRTHRKSVLASDFYEAFRWTRKNPLWKSVKFAQARAGDYLAYQYKNVNKPTTGHLVILAGRPIRRRTKAKGRVVWTVRVADSARTGHSYDTRKNCHNHACGVGFGTMQFETYRSGKLRGFQWSVGRRKSFNVLSLMAVGRFNLLGVAKPTLRKILPWR